MSVSASGRPRASVLDFLDGSPTPAHAVELARSYLISAGFEELSEREVWTVEPGMRLFCTRGGTSIVACLAGELPPSRTGFRVIAAHTDFPCLRLKPKAAQALSGYSVLRAEVYGSPILATWFDRDLGLAGRLWLRAPDSGGGPGMQELLFSTGALCRIPSLAIHLDRQVNEEGFKFNREDNMLPVCGVGQEDPDLTGMIAESAGVDPERVAAFAADLYDVQPAATGGRCGELLLSGRLDNLAMCHCGLRAIESCPPGLHTCVLALFDSEEVGSRTSAGAFSNFLSSILERLAVPTTGKEQGMTGSRQDLFVALSRSMILSADAAHALHPGFGDRHDSSHRPVLNSGPVLKVNASMRYSTTAATAGYLRQCAGVAGVPVQDLVMRNDRPCGSTIGPILSSALGAASIDVGNPILSMHSVRETGGTADHEMMIRLMEAHFGPEVPLDPWIAPSRGSGQVE
ncbi:M18 family aminopeptidase [Candidatus Fermentibacterales bacterium]|nr:M18 family aminopeptidase [Candidatus Fermentibacterales bacterium]